MHLDVRNDQDCARRAGITIEIRHARGARKPALTPACIARRVPIGGCFRPAAYSFGQYSPPRWCDAKLKRILPASVLAPIAGREEAVLDRTHIGVAGEGLVVGEPERALSCALAPVGEGRGSARLEIEHHLPRALQTGLRRHHRIERNADAELDELVVARRRLDVAEPVA